MAVYELVVYLFILSMFSRVFGNVPATNHSGSMAVHLKNQTVFVTFMPNFVEGLMEGETAKVSYEITSWSSSSHHSVQIPPVKLKVQSKDTEIVTVLQPMELILGSHTNGTSSNSSFITIKGHFLGRTVLEFSVAEGELGADRVEPTSGGEGAQGQSAQLSYSTGSSISQDYLHMVSNSSDDNSPYTQTILYLPRDSGEESMRTLDFNYHVSVVRKHGVLDSIFISVIVVIIVLANVGMGCKIDLEVIKEVTRRPVAPAIGMACQYVVMPLLSFAIIKILGLQGGVALGMFATGCAPGGGASNMYAYLLKGDVSLSVTMTFFSTMAALGLIPFWLFTLGRVILDEEASSHIVIPYANIIYSLLLLLIPVGIGILIQRFRPTWSKYILKTLRPVFLFFIIFIFTFGVYTNLFIFRLFTPKLVAAGILLPYVGFFLGGIIAFASRQTWTRIKTIAVETGIQNTGVAFLVVTFTLPQPEADLSMVSPIIVATFTPIPMLIAIAIVEYRARCMGPKTETDKELQSPATDEATFDKSDQKIALNGNSETMKNDTNSQHTNNSEYPLIDDKQDTAFVTT